MPRLHSLRARRRRSPEVARQELLDAAERVFARVHPEDAGLKEVAREAGVSHGLITHYFGTYDGLVASVLERHTTQLRERVFAALQDSEVLTKPELLVEMLFSTYQDPVRMRLMTYLISGDRPGLAHAFSLQNKGIAQVSARLAARLELVAGGPALSAEATAELVDAIAIGLAIAVAAAFGYAATRHSLAGAIGKPLTPALDRSVRAALADMVHAYILRAKETAQRSPG